MMRILSYLVIALVVFGCGQETTTDAVQTNGTSSPSASKNSITISGQVESEELGPHAIVSIFNPVDQSLTGLDTAKAAAGGAYTLEVALAEPQLVKLDLFGRKSIMMILTPEDPSVTVNVNAKRDTEISGSEATDKMQAYEAFRKESYGRLIKPSYSKMSAAKAVNETALEVEAVAEYVKNSEIHRKELLEFTEKEIGTSPALFGTMLRWTGDDEIGRLERLVDNFAAAHPDWSMTKVMQGKVDRFRQVAIGVKAPPLVAAGPDGQTVSLYDNLGKVTLIDFWASWCGPCISQLPDLQRVYNEFSDEGFEIFGLSVDHKQDKWLDALKKHDMPWLHASDLAGWQSPLAAAYNVTFVPYNVLLDAEGKIIAKNLHEKELFDRVAERLQ